MASVFLFPQLLQARDKTTSPISATNIPSRNRGVLTFGLLAAAATAVAFKYKSHSIRSNEVTQQQLKAPNGYVSVDRSGGGI